MTATSAPRPPRLLVISGSARTGSLNRELAELAAHKARALGAETTSVDLRALGLPVFDADLLQAQGMPQGALQLRDWMAQHDGVLLANPEYNALPTPLCIYMYTEEYFGMSNALERSQE